MSPQLPDGILFDMDNTVLDFSGAMHRAWRKVCEAVVGTLDGLTVEALLIALNEHRRWYFDDAERHRRGRLQPDVALVELCEGALVRAGSSDTSAGKEMARLFKELRVESIRPYPGALETLTKLRGSGVKLALVTNGSAEIQRAKIERWDLERYFDHVQVEEEFGAGKPEPIVYRHALERLGVDASGAWMVGDNLEWEVAAPQRLGIVGIWVDAAGNGLPEDSDVTPDRIVRSITELWRA